MKQKEIITKITHMIQREAYCARVYEELCLLNFDKGIMAYHQDIALGRAFGGLDLLQYIKGKAQDDIYDKARDEAIEDIKKADNNIVNLLNLLGFNGEEYYRIETQS